MEAIAQRRDGKGSMAPSSCSPVYNILITRGNPEKSMESVLKILRVVRRPALTPWPSSVAAT